MLSYFFASKPEDPEIEFLLKQRKEDIVKRLIEAEKKLDKALEFIRYVKCCQGEIIPGRNEAFIPSYWIQPRADSLFEELSSRGK